MAKNHPFIDGNKRTAFAVMDTFLRVNGYILNTNNEET
ncbi:MAG: type II toxin-antitoxin system death-on-curing family toxin [Rivularia sp. (in: cyanobacteria)]